MPTPNLRYDATTRRRKVAFGRAYSSRSRQHCRRTVVTRTAGAVGGLRGRWRSRLADAALRGTQSIGPREETRADRGADSMPLSHCRMLQRGPRGAPQQAPVLWRQRKKHTPRPFVSAKNPAGCLRVPGRTNGFQPTVRSGGLSLSLLPIICLFILGNMNY